jgi:hypothetical protein
MTSNKHDGTIPNILATAQTWLLSLLFPYSCRRALVDVVLVFHFGKVHAAVYVRAMGRIPFCNISSHCGQKRNLKPNNNIQNT